MEWEKDRQTDRQTDREVAPHTYRDGRECLEAVLRCHWLPVHQVRLTTILAASNRHCRPYPRLLLALAADFNELSGRVLPGANGERSRLKFNAELFSGSDTGPATNQPIN